MKPLCDAHHGVAWPPLCAILEITRGCRGLGLRLAYRFATYFAYVYGMPFFLESPESIMTPNMKILICGIVVTK